jgi:hypothetical protein
VNPNAAAAAAAAQEQADGDRATPCGARSRGCGSGGWGNTDRTTQRHNPWDQVNQQYQQRAGGRQAPK